MLNKLIHLQQEYTNEQKQNPQDNCKLSYKYPVYNQKRIHS